MNRVDIKNLGRANNGRNVQIAQRGRRWPDAGRFVSKAHVQRVAIDVAVHGNRANTHLFASPDNSAGNLAPVGDQDLAKWSDDSGHN